MRFELQFKDSEGYWQTVHTGSDLDELTDKYLILMRDDPTITARVWDTELERMPA